MTSPRTEEEALALAESFLELQARIKKLEEGSRANRLSNSSIDLASGRGYIPLMEAGLEKGRIGRQPDGTVNLTFANDTDPPTVPLLPLVDPGLGTLTVRVIGLQAGEPFNFSHVNVYCDGVRVGTIAKLPGTWIVGPLDATEHSIQVSAVSVGGAESTKTTPVLMIPDMVTERNFVTNPIQRTEILDGAINTPKLAANAVEAGNIAANAVRAAAIQAGSINADKMAAQIFMASVAFICGNPLAERLVIDAAGLTQFDEEGSFTFGIGANPDGGNFLTVVGPTGQALAAIDQDGNIVGQDVVVAGDLNLGGVSLIDNLNSLPRGMIEWANTSTNTALTSSEIGIMELDVQVSPTRHYRIATNTGYLGGAEVGGSGAQAETRLHFTVNGSRPTITSPILEISARATGFGEPMSIDCLFDGAKCPGGRLRLLYSVTSLTAGAAIGLVTPAGNAEANDLQLWIEDIGPRRAQTGIASNGGGSTAPPVSNYTREYSRQWSKVWSSASPSGSTSAELYQGDAGYGPGRSLIGFDDDQIRADLSGATITKVEVYLYANHWWYNSGGTVILGTHNYASAPGNTSWPGSNGEVTRWNLGKPEGRWVTVPNSVGDNLKNNSIKGLALPYGGTDKNFYGKFNPTSPKLRISYRK